ncbi:MAG: PH domain-containing protein [Candidatus Krumholzibacteriales bacterium]
MGQRIRPDRKYFTKSIMVWAAISAVIIAAAALIHLIVYLAEGDPAAPPVVWIVAISLALLLWVIGLPLNRIWINNLSYVITDDRIIVYKGILTRKQQNIPFRAVTDFVLSRSVYDRILGIGSVLVQTAGQSQTAGGYEGCLRGLLEYESLYSGLKDKLRDAAISGARTTIEPDAEKSGAVLEEILGELRKISRSLEKGDRPSGD